MVDGPNHAATEERYILIGMSELRRLLFVSFVERGDTVRIISARELTRRERADYEDTRP
jgi:hypothetical protein